MRSHAITAWRPVTFPGRDDHGETPEIYPDNRFRGLRRSAGRISSVGGDNCCRFVHTDEMEIRKLREEDAPAWWKLRLEALELDPRAFGTAAEEHRATTIAAAAKRIREMPPSSFILGVFEAACLVANATFMRETGIKERHKGHILGVYVTAAHRGQRLAARLLDELLRLAQERPGLEQIHLGVGTYNTAAIKTYERLGFKTWGTELRALKVGAESIDEHQMVLNLI